MKTLQIPKSEDLEFRQEKVPQIPEEDDNTEEKNVLNKEDKWDVNTILKKLYDAIELKYKSVHKQCLFLMLDQLKKQLDFLNSQTTSAADTFEPTKLDIIENLRQIEQYLDVVEYNKKT